MKTLLILILLALGAAHGQGVTPDRHAINPWSRVLQRAGLMPQISILLASQTAAASGCGSTYAHCASIVIPSAPSTLTDFSNVVAPLSQWAVVGSGGQVLHTVTQSGGGASITVPADFVITSDSACTTAIPFEWEVYASSTGTGSVIWVKTTRATSGSTTVYGCWGSSGTTYLGNVNGTWNAAFTRVYHLPTIASALDSTGSACTGTENGTPTATTGEVDGAANFVAASSQYFEIASCNMPAPPFTLSAWIKPSGGVYGAILGNAGTNGTIEWRLNTSNTLDLLAQGVANVGTSSTAVGTSTWHHVAVTYDQTTAHFYLDGAADGSPASSQIISQATSSTIGEEGGGGEYMSGGIDEIEVSNVVRSADWISATHSNQATPITPMIIQ